jgi:hypothetical protein
MLTPPKRPTVTEMRYDQAWQSLKTGSRPRLTSTHILSTLLDVNVQLVGDSGTFGSSHILRAEERSHRDDQKEKGKTTEEHGG